MVLLSTLFGWLIPKIKPTPKGQDEVYAEWYQCYFEIYCSNCHEEAKMRADHGDYIYSKRCPHCNARMKNATIFGYKKAIRK